MRAALQKYKNRADQGKKSFIRIRGQSVQYAEIISYFKRKHVGIEDVIAQRHSSTTPGVVECLTPLPFRISTPEVHAVPEEVLLTIRDYCYGSFEAGTWIKTEPFDNCYSIKEGPLSSDPTYKLYSHASMACDLFDRGHSKEAGQSLIAATAGIKTIIQLEAPRMLQHIFAFILKVCGKGRPEIVLAVLKTFSDFGKILLCESHPLRRMCSGLASMNTGQLQQVAIRAVESRIGHFEAILRPMHISTLDAHGCYFEAIDEWRNDGQAERNLRDLIEECSAKLGDYDYRVLYCRMYFVCYLIRKRRYLEASRECQDIFKHILTFGSRPKMVNIESEGLHLQRWKPGLPQREQIEVNQRETIRLCMVNRGRRDARTRIWLVTLERCLRTWGQESSADEVCGWMQAILDSIGKDSSPEVIWE